MRLKGKLSALQGRVMLSWVSLLSLLRPIRLFRWVYLKLASRMVEKSGLFDSDYYLRTQPDVADSAVPPLMHYLLWGDKEGRSPSLFFDPVYYRTGAVGFLVGVGSLLHFAYIGRYVGNSPSPWFDIKYYLINNPDVRRSGVNPLLHYMKWGGYEGRSPSQSFNSRFYLHAYPDVVEAGVNPLAHYLLYGRFEGRATCAASCYGGEVLSDVPEPRSPGMHQWLSLSRRNKQTGITCDVIVPVYKGYAATLRCLYSVLNSEVCQPFELIVVNDCSPEVELVDVLRGLAKRGLFTYLENAKNLGFVCTVNRGMSLHCDRDVVLLNSDAEVYGDWLDRLMNAADSSPNVGTVTPLSNNATICSYPRFLYDNPYPIEIDYAKLDAIASGVNDGLYIEAPTGVGFCMLIRRQCLVDAGLFDEKAFGKGYGEENDFCQRIMRMGWKNMVASNVFVRHWGGASFQGESAMRIASGLKVIAKRYPNYQKDVTKFINEDPLKNARSRLDWQRLIVSTKDKNVLIVSHARGGGTERHLQEDIARLAMAGYGVFTLRPVKGSITEVKIGRGVEAYLPNLESYCWDNVQTIISALKELRITEIHSHSLVDFGPQAPAHLSDIVGAMDVRWEANVHDYKVVCPRINMADEAGRYCGEPDDQGCNECLRSRGSDFAVTDIVAWRRLHRDVLKAASVVVVPDEDVVQRLMRYFPDLSYEVSPHEDLSVFPIQRRMPVVRSNGRIHIVAIGAISRLKGYDIIRACAKDARTRRLPLDFSIMGYSMDDDALIETGVSITGKYQEDDANDLLDSLEPTFVWLPSLWPETYSYTLSIALKKSFPVVAFDIGAISARLHRMGFDDFIMPLELINSPRKINDLFLRFTKRVALDIDNVPDLGMPSKVKSSAGFEVSLKTDA